ncbi:unnamed protein product [Rotaria sp. Silwood2]|nr:unnamed protein product [Rotaria sp. Silwood2]
MEMHNNHGKPSEEVGLSSSDNDTIINLNHINKICIRDSMILNCKHIFRTDGLRSDIELINDLLFGIVNLDRDMLKKKILPRISRRQMGEELYNDICNWLDKEGSILIVKYLPYLSIACNMTFYQCNVRNHRDHDRIFVPVDQNHDIANAIYYMCDRSGQNIIAICITDHSYINHIHNKLLLSTDKNVNDKVELYNILISEYIKQAKSLQFHQHLLLLSKWQYIYKCYKAKMQLTRDLTPIDLLDYCQCLIMLSKYSDAENLISNVLLRINQTDETWHLLVKAQRKCKNYSNTRKEKEKHEMYLSAIESISKALKQNEDNTEVKNERTIINKLIERASREETFPEHDIRYRRHIDNCSSYNILSIDGGGIRGIMAAIWLRELERKTKRTCSSMFQMMAGTSTGAIIAAGLSVPDKYNRTIPAHNASELVELYKTRGKDIFIKKSRNFCNYHRSSFSLAPKYSSNGKRNLFEHYFGQTLLSECLTDIVIPIVRSADTYTHLFTRNDSLYSTSLVDVLMATTAAPTYFKPHILYGTNHIDGGVQMNNPTMAAYTKAIEYGYEKENIFVLSLGTGDYIEDPLVANDHPDIIYYLRNRNSLVKVLLDSQQHNVDYQMSILMNDEHYYRWQVWFEELIQLDKYETDIVNKLENIAYEYWEEMEIYDNNRLNRLIERLRFE